MEFPLRHSLIVPFALALSTSAIAVAPPLEPVPLALTYRIPASTYIPSPVTNSIDVDATDTARAIFRVKQTIPVAAAGPLTLLYPEWLPGNHAPRGPIASIAGLKVSADGKPIAWRRDPANVYAFHIDVSEGVGAIDVEFQHLSPTEKDEGRIVMTPEMMNVQWEKMTLYPAGSYVRNINVRPSITLPAGWQGAPSLDVAKKSANRITYKPDTYETRHDPPNFA